MALPYQNTNQFNLPQSAQSVIPQALGEDFLATLNRSMDLSDQTQENNLLGFQESRGLLKSGSTNQDLVSQVLGPSEDRRNQALLGIAVPAAQQGQQQQFQTGFEQMQFGQTQQLQAQQFQDQLAYAQQQYEFNRQLAILGQQLQQQSVPDFGARFMQSFGPAMGSAASNFAGGALGGLLGGMGGGGGNGTVGTGMGNTSAFGPSANFF